MKQREKILVGCCLAAVGVAAVLELGPRLMSSGSVAEPAPDPIAIAQGLRASLMASPLQAWELRTLERLNPEDWIQAERFLKPDDLRDLASGRRQTQSPANLPVYMGYCQIGDRVYAWIDGMEYVEGDYLSNHPHQVVKIQPDHVRLLPSGAQESISVYLEPEMEKRD